MERVVITHRRSLHVKRQSRQIKAPIITEHESNNLENQKMTKVEAEEVSHSMPQPLNDWHSVELSMDELVIHRH